MKRVTIMLENFEGISETQGKMLVGGFSASFSVSTTASLSTEKANNCKGGNCVEGCGSNPGCNVVVGCGGVQ